jgi:hypothetical protein
VSAEREGEKLLLELVEPRRLHGQMDCARLDRRRLSGHTHDFAAIWIDANGATATLRPSCHRI